MSTIRIKNWNINLELGFITDGNKFASLEKVKSKIIKENPLIVSKYKLYSKLDFQTREITKLIAWDSLLGELIENEKINEYV